VLQTQMQQQCRGGEDLAVSMSQAARSHLHSGQHQRVAGGTTEDAWAQEVGD
jgi:hypothetical protein